MQEIIKKNLLLIQEEIAPYKSNIIAVTKYFDQNAIISAYQAGLRNFGESRVIEASEKINNLPIDIRFNSKFHFIGHLQSNKVKKAVEFFDYIHSVDTSKLAQKISEEACKINKKQKVFLQVNNANEIQKSGFSIKTLCENFENITKLDHIEVVGLMNMAPVDASDKELDELFSEIANLQVDLQTKYNCKLIELSMGMSRDYKIAVRHGATMLRIGRKLFSK